MNRGTGIVAAVTRHCGQGFVSRVQPFCLIILIRPFFAAVGRQRNQKYRDCIRRNSSAFRGLVLALLARSVRCYCKNGCKSASAAILPKAVQQAFRKDARSEHGFLYEPDLAHFFTRPSGAIPAFFGPKARHHKSNFHISAQCEILSLRVHSGLNLAVLHENQRSVRNGQKLASDPNSFA